MLRRCGFYLALIITLRATPADSPPRKNKRPILDHAFAKHRAIIGSRMRKIAMRGDIDALRDLLRNPETMIAVQARRLQNGLTRRRGGVQRERQTPRLESGAALSAASADTS